jgi:hypothetical protein
MTGLAAGRSGPAGSESDPGPHALPSEHTQSTLSAVSGSLPVALSVDLVSSSPAGSLHCQWASIDLRLL